MERRTEVVRSQSGYIFFEWVLLPLTLQSFLTSGPTHTHVQIWNHRVSKRTGNTFAEYETSLKAIVHVCVGDVTMTPPIFIHSQRSDLSGFLCTTSSIQEDIPLTSPSCLKHNELKKNITTSK